MTFNPIDPSKDATFQVTLGASFDEAPRHTFHGLKYNFKPAAIDYSQPGTLTHAEDSTGEVSLVVASTAEGEHHVFRGPLQETKSNEFILVYDPETNCFVLDRVSSISRLSATRGSRTNTLNGASATPSSVDRPAESTRRNRSKSNDDVPRISLDPSTNKDNIIDIESLDEEEEGDEQPVLPTLVTPRLPPASPGRARGPSSSSQKQQIVSSDDDSEIDIGPPSSPLATATAAAAAVTTAATTADADDDVSDGDLDDLANELESSLENRPGSSSEDVDDSDGPPRGKAPDFGNVPRSGGPISMSRFAGGRRRQEEESSSSDDDDDD